MVSYVKYDTLPQIHKQTLKERIITALFFITGCLIVYITDGAGLFYIFISIVLFGILRKIISYFSHGNHDEEININEEIN